MRGPRTQRAPRGEGRKKYPGGGGDPRLREGTLGDREGIRRYREVPRTEREVEMTPDQT